MFLLWHKCIHYDTLTKMKAPFFVAAPFYAVVTTYIVLEEYEKALELDEKMPLHVVGNSLLYFDYISWSLLLHLAVLPAPTKVCIIYIIYIYYFLKCYLCYFMVFVLISVKGWDRRKVESSIQEIRGIGFCKTVSLLACPNYTCQSWDCSCKRRNCKGI